MSTIYFLKVRLPKTHVRRKKNHRRSSGRGCIWTPFPHRIKILTFYCTKSVRPPLEKLPPPPAIINVLTGIFFSNNTKPSVTVTMKLTDLMFM